MHAVPRVPAGTVTLPLPPVPARTARPSGVVTHGGDSDTQQGQGAGSVLAAAPGSSGDPRAQRSAVAGAEGVLGVFLGCEAAWHQFLTLLSSGGTLPSHGLAVTGEGWEGMEEGPGKPLRDPPQLFQSFGMRWMRSERVQHQHKV